MDYIYMNIKKSVGTFKEVQWLRLCASTAGATALIPGGKTKIPHATQWPKKEKGKKMYM